MFIKLTKTDGTPVWMNPEFIVRFEPWKKGSAVAVAGDGDFEVMEDTRTILAMAGGVRVAQAPKGEGRAPARPATGETPVVPVAPAATGETPVVPVASPATGETPVVPVASPATGETPVVPVRKTRSRKKATSEPTPKPTPAPTPEPVPEPEPAPAPAANLFPEPPDEVAVAAAILKKHRCRSRKRIQNTIKSLNPKMSMEAARALLEQMEARGFVVIDEQGHATFT